MPKDYSPFTPGLPVPVEFFVGRSDQIKRLRDKVGKAAQGRLQVAFLLGERGIGKSSLAHFVKFLVEKDDGVLGLHTFLGGVTSLEEMVRRVLDRLLKESADKIWFGKIKDFFGRHIKQVGLFGVSLEFDASQRDLQTLVNDFGPALRDLMQRVKEDKKGLFLILDDINGLATSVEFATWLKSLLDDISTFDSPLPLCLLVVGYEERRQSLIKLQPSLARPFDLIEISAWTDEETSNFFENALSKVNIAIKRDALKYMVKYAGGLPVLAQEIGESVFNWDADNSIDEEDAEMGVLLAAEIVGRKLIQPQVLQTIQSKRYRELLRKIALNISEMQFQRAEVYKHLIKEERKVFDNFLRKMTALNVFVRPERGAYKFVNLLHNLYFQMEAVHAFQGTWRDKLWAG
jgi:AAA+ ATPase superfamily predicted ATPase